MPSLSRPARPLAGKTFLVAVLLLSAFAPPNHAQCQRAKLSADDGARDDLFGFSVAISGLTAVAGVPFDDGDGHNYGAAYVFERSGTVWAPVDKLFPPDDGGLVGRSVAIDDDVTVVGATGAWTTVFERSNGVWSQVTQLIPDDYSPGSLFGYAVSVTGNLAVVGAPHDDDNGYQSGSAYVFERDPNGAWSQVGKLVADDGEAYDEFAISVAIDGDVAVTGAHWDFDLGNYSGSAYVFERDASGVWSQAAKLLPHDGDVFWSFGEAVAVSGNRVLVGAPTAHAFAPSGGAAYIFERDPNGAWPEVAQLVSDDIANSDVFGASVALDGDVAVIGAWGDDDYGEHTGAAYVFVQQPGGTWPQVAKLLADDGAAQDRFGNAVAVSGNTAIIGAWHDDDHGEDSGSAYVFAVGPDDDGNGVMDDCECIGDLDGDYEIGLSDLAQLLSNYGTTSGASYEDGDIEPPGGDGDVDLADLAALLAVYRTACW